MPNESSLLQDIEDIQQISIIPTILEVVCQATGMGFAAVARVTSERWIACSVHDEIGFGLKPGGELAVESTICGEIRDSGQAVVIDNVAESPEFRNHHTPLQYGFQSYISVPIILKSGEFFGTLCAIDPRPALLTSSKAQSMFNLFAELIAFHLSGIAKMRANDRSIQELNRSLTDSRDENRQYQYISHHTLKEPLRKIMIFSSMLVEAADTDDKDRVRTLAGKINGSAAKFSNMIKDLSEFSTLAHVDDASERVDLNPLLSTLVADFSPLLKAKDVTVDIGVLPLVNVEPLQVGHLFQSLLSIIIDYLNAPGASVLRIYTVDQGQSELAGLPGFAEIRLHAGGLLLDGNQLETMFDLFGNMGAQPEWESSTTGLAYCRKIVRSHGGTLTARTDADGTVFSMTLPLHKAASGFRVGAVHNS